MTTTAPWWRSARVRATVAATIVVTAVALWLVRGPVATVWWTSWGPDQPWTHRDLLGALWLWHAEASGGVDLWLAGQNHPTGAPDIRHHIPNPFDAWVMGPVLRVLGGSVYVWWGAVQVAHHLANVWATVALARAAGARASGMVAAGLLVAATPVMLHEVAGGRGLSGAVWPGLLGLAVLLRGRAGPAGVLIGVQALCYLYTGALFGVVALVLRPRWGLVVGASVVLAPYLAWLSPLLQGLHGRPPPADYSILPLPGLWGSEAVPARLRMAPWVWVGLVAAVVTRRWRWALVTGLAVVVALGPTPGAKSQAAVVASPLAWLMVWIPGLGRMHHPIRAVLVAVPLLAVAGGRTWPRVALVSAALAVAGGAAMQDAAAWGQARSRPGMAAARYIAAHPRGAVVDLTGAGAEALALHIVHGQPMLEGLRKPMGSTTSGRLRARADGWARAEAQPGLREALAAEGFGYVLVVDRSGDLSRDVYTTLANALGPPVYPGVYALPSTGPKSAPPPAGG